MILPRFASILAIAALAAAAAASLTPAAGAASHHKQRKAHLPQQTAAKARATVEKLAATAASSGSPQLRGQRLASAADAEYKAGITYYWVNDACSGNAVGAVYWSPDCFVNGDGTSSRFSCNEDAGEVTVNLFWSLDCSGPVVASAPAHIFTPGQCVEESKTVCSTELLYGMDDSIFVAHHMDANCTSIFTGTLEPKNCNGIGQSITCSDGVRHDKYYDEDDCSGNLIGEEDYPYFSECIEDVSDDDYYQYDEYESNSTIYVKGFCSSEDVLPQNLDDDDAAPATAASWATLLLASVAAYAIVARA